MSLESVEQTLKAIDTITKAQSAVISAEQELVAGAWPKGVELGDIPTESDGWNEVAGRDVLITRLHGLGSETHWLFSFFDQASEDQRTALETLYGSLTWIGRDSELISRELDEMRLMFQSVLDTIPARVFWKDLDSVYQGSNRLFANDAGYDNSDEIRGKTDYDMSWLDQAELYRSDDQQVMSSKQAKVDYEEPQTNPAGDQVWLQTSKIPLKDVSNDIVGVLGTYADITPRKEAEAERDALLVDLETKNAELERFTYTVSHDLKSPLVTIQGFLGILEKDIRKICAEQPDAQTPLFDSTRRIKRAAKKMTQLLEELLEISRVGRVLNPCKPETLRALIDDAVLRCSGALREVEADLQIDGEFPTVLVDGQRIVQVVQNLVDNACKYRHPDRPLILRITGHNDGTLTVADNGIGIPQRYHKRIFRIFEKLDLKIEGSGIGLALVKRIVETHGGTVRVESDDDRCGTTFHLTLPLS